MRGRKRGSVHSEKVREKYDRCSSFLTQASRPCFQFIREPSEEADFGKHSCSPLSNRLIQEPIGSVPSTASHQALIMGYGHLGYSQRRWSVANQHAQPHHPVTMNRDHSFTRSIAPATYNPICGKYPCSTSAFHMASILPY